MSVSGVLVAEGIYVGGDVGMSATKFEKLDYFRMLYGEKGGLRPADGETGWRVSRLDSSGVIDLADRDGLVKAHRCTTRPTLFGSLQIFDSHAAPHANCVCGFRLLLHLEDLWKYWDRSLRIHKASGLSWDDYYGTSDFVVIRAEARDMIAGGVQDDPLDTIRAGVFKPLEVYLPPWINVQGFKRRNPHVTPLPMDDLPGGEEMFAPMREPRPPAATLTCQSMKRHLRVVTGVADVMVPRSHLQPQRVRDAIWGAVRLENANDCLDELVDRLVIPLTDVEDPADRIGCANGLAHGLVRLADAHQKVGKF